MTKNIPPPFGQFRQLDFMRHEGVLVKLETRLVETSNFGYVSEFRVIQDDGTILYQGQSHEEAKEAFNTLTKVQST